MGIMQEIPQVFHEYIRPIHAEPDAGYRFRLKDEMEHSRGVAWTGEIWYNETLVAIADNQGNGGPNNYEVKDELGFARFQRESRRVYPVSAESDDEFVQLLDILSASGV